MRCGGYGTIPTAWGQGCPQRATSPPPRSRPQSRSGCLRQFQTDLCVRGEGGAAGAPRLYDWVPKGYGLGQPVLFTARDGATIAAHVWATRAGPAKPPGIVITTGSLHAPERLYWY